MIDKTVTVSRLLGKSSICDCGRNYDYVMDT